MPQAVTVRSLPRAFELVKGMQARGLELGESYRALGRQALASIVQGQMSQAIDEHLERMAVLDQADRRNGSQEPTVPLGRVATAVGIWPARDAEAELDLQQGQHAGRPAGR